MEKKFSNPALEAGKYVMGGVAYFFDGGDQLPRGICFQLKTAEPAKGPKQVLGYVFNQLDRNHAIVISSELVGGHGQLLECAVDEGIDTKKLDLAVEEGRIVWYSLAEEVTAS